jgi:hypothetical protein
MGSYIICAETNTCAEVTGFSASLGKLTDVPIVSAALAYDCPETYSTYILIFHQVLYLPDLNAHLICPNQLRANQIRVNDCPLQFLPTAERKKNAHSIEAKGTLIPLTLRGVMSYFNVRCPTESEMEDPERYPQIKMTSPSEWRPYDKQLSNDELMLTKYDQHNDPIPRIRQLSAIDTETEYYGSVFDNHLFHHKLNRKLLVAQSYIMSAVSNRRGTVTAAQLSSRWFIGLNAAQRTIDRTTQLGVRDFSLTKGYRQLKHTAHQLMYKQIRALVYTDTMFTKVKSLRQNTCAQVFVTDFHWTCTYPMKTKSEAHLTLERLHKEVGVFNTIIPDNAPELASGELKRKAIHAGSRVKPIEAYTHNQNLAESAIRELRRMYWRAMLSTGAPHVLWDHCLLLMSEIRTHTALDLPTLDGDTPHTRLTGDTPDISHLCEFTWYGNVWYIEPIDKMENRKLAKYLGPSHDVGSAMCMKLLLKTGREINRTSVIPLSIEDKNSDTCKERIKEFDRQLKESLGNRAEGLVVNEGEDDFMQYEPYGDDTNTLHPIVVPDQTDVDELNKYIQARVLIPHGVMWSLILK